MKSGLELKSAKKKWNALLPYLRAARANAGCALHVLMNIEQSGNETALHLVRGWHALSCFLAAAAGSDIPRESSFVEEIDLSAFPKYASLSPENWRKDLLVYQQTMEFPSWHYSGEAALSFKSLRIHIRFLESAIEFAVRKIKRDLGIKFWKPIYTKLIGGSVVLLLLLFGLLAAIDKVMHPNPFWLAQYFAGTELQEQPIGEASYSEIAFNWGEIAPDDTIPADNFSVRWTTCIHLNQEQSFNFKLGSDDGSRLLIDGKPVIDRWSIRPFDITEGVQLLSAGAHTIVVEYFEANGGATIKFSSNPRLNSVNASLPAEGNPPYCP